MHNISETYQDIQKSLEDQLFPSYGQAIVAFSGSVLQRNK